MELYSQWKRRHAGGVGAASGKKTTITFFLEVQHK
jgi:hypothetical protein